MRTVLIALCVAVLLSGCGTVGSGSSGKSLQKNGTSALNDPDPDPDPSKMPAFTD